MQEASAACESKQERPHRLAGTLNPTDPPRDGSHESRSWLKTSCSRNSPTLNARSTNCLPAYRDVASRTLRRTYSHQHILIADLTTSHVPGMPKQKQVPNMSKTRRAPHESFAAIGRASWPSHHHHQDTQLIKIFVAFVLVRGCSRLEP